MATGPAIPPGPSGSAMLPVFVINLDRRPDRWAAMSAQLDKLGIQATRIAAVDARLLAAQEDWEQGANGNAPEYPNWGAVAVVYSHRKAFRAFLDTDAQAALILEDDAELADDTPLLLKAIDWWPPGARVIRLETGTITPTKSILLGPALTETPSGRTVHRFERWAPGTAAFLINREGAAFVLPYLDNPMMPSDHLLFDHRVSQLARELRALQITPGAARQTEGPGTSDLEEYWRKYRKDGRKHDRSRLARASYKVKLIALRFMGRVKKRQRGVYYSPSPTI